MIIPSPRELLKLICGAKIIQTWPGLILDEPRYLFLASLFVGVKVCKLEASAESGGNIYSTNAPVTVSGSPFGGELNQTDSRQSIDFARKNADLGKYIQN